MAKIKTYGNIKDGHLHIIRRKDLDNAISNTEDCRIVLTIEKYYKKRSVFQNAYYWDVIINCFIQGIMETHGEKITPNDAHGELKRFCNGFEITNKETGETEKIGKTTTALTTVQAEEYYEDCRRWIAEWLNITVPLPNEQTEIF